MNTKRPHNQLNIKLLPREKKILIGTQSVSFRSKPIAWRILKRLAESNKPLKSDQILAATYDYWAPTRSIQFRDSMRKAMVRTMSRIRSILNAEFKNSALSVQFLNYDKTRRTWQFATLKR